VSLIFEFTYFTPPNHDQNRFRQLKRRSLCSKKGFFEWMGKESPDIVCVQELKAQAPDMTADFLNPHGYHGHFHYAEKKAIPELVCIARKTRRSTHRVWQRRI
jgi:exonuclease III